MKRWCEITAAVVAMSIVAAGNLAADELSITNLMGKVPTQDEIIQGLITPTGLRIEPVAAEGAPQPAEDAGERPLGAIALEIKFDFDSANLTLSAREILDQLGAALKSDELQSSAFLVEGHTDSIGADDYNQQLSERRAQAVSSYLSGQIGIEPVRLTTVGRGEAQPFDTTDPAGGVNRRVQIVNLGG